MYDLVIIGGGAAGLGAALYAARFKLNVAVVAKEFGGTGNIAHKVDNWIGSPGITGPELMENFVNHVKEYKVPLIEDEVVSVEKKGSTFVIKGKEKEFESRSLIFANGMKHRKLNVKGEEEFAGKGVHYCYTCDGPLYFDATVAVIGGSDSAALGAIFMEEYAKEMYVIYRGKKLRAEPVSSERVYAMKKAKVIHEANVVEIYGDNVVQGVKLDTGEDVKLDAVFIEIGHIPLNELAVSVGVEVDSHGFIKVDSDMKTNVEGVFAAGDITNGTSLKQFITSAADGSISAQSAYYFLN
jgi:thioredoxin reductase (NADPH)